MNIKITYKWLLDYLETDADPYELQKYLSLCGPGFERVDKVGDDYVFDIEVTSNRVDMASVFGIAQEATAILPQFGKKAKLKFNPLEKYTFKLLQTLPAVIPAKAGIQGSPIESRMTDNEMKTLDVKILGDDLCSRFTTIILSDIKINQAPDFISKRLQMCDIKSINNVVDISNYLMISLGQPTHMFDYDSIEEGKLIMRESKEGEIIVTLDDKKIILPGGDIVMEDGSQELIDLCGIMGGLDSSINEKTKNVVLFVQTYNKRKIRKTSMTTGQRTVAATYFEKDLDEERVEPTLVYGVELLQKYAGAKINSELTDIYPHPYTPKTIEVTTQDIKRVMGMDIESEKVTSILENLGFGVKSNGIAASSLTPRNDDVITYTITVPSYRKDDVNIKQDIIEEIARVYGYHNLSNSIQTTTYVKQPKDMELLHTLQHKVKLFLKHLGLHEVMNYSMISEDMIEKLDLKKEEHLKLANTISEEIKYMRTSLIPSLIKNMKENEGKENPLKLFELSKVYFPQPNDLPLEKYRLTIAVNTDFFDLKGILESLFRELHIEYYEFKTHTEPHMLPHIQAEIFIDGKAYGLIGELKPTYQERFEIKNPVFIAELAFQPLMDNYRLLPMYKQPNPYAVIKLDLTISDSKLSFAEIKEKAHKTSKLLTNVEVVDMFKGNLTIRFYFSSTEKNITEEDAKAEFEKIKEAIKV